MNVREGTHTLYIMHARRVAQGEGPNGEFKELPDSRWFHASQDSFGFHEGHQAWQKTGEHGWLDMDTAKEALRQARAKKWWENKHRGNIESRTKYEFRLCLIFMVRKDQVLEL